MSYEYMELFNQAGQIRENLHTYNYIKKRQLNGGPINADEARYLVEMEKRIKGNLDYYNQYLDYPFKNNNDPNYFVDNHNYYEEFWDEDEN